MGRAQQHPAAAAASGLRRAPAPLRRRRLDRSQLASPSAQARALSAGAVEVLPAGELERKLALGRPLRIKLGLDPTAPDIHLGHTVVLQRMREFQDAGHEVVLIIGDFTARVGDPSGRSKTRPPLSPAQIDEAARTYAEQAFRVLDRSRTEIRRNSEWLDMRMTELFALASTTTLARLLERDDFSNRMAANAPISMLEMLYPLIQGYDSVAVNADVELGGTDQTFNLLLARDIQRHYRVPEQVCLTLPLLTGLDGEKKMSKSLGNYIGVTENPDEAFGKAMSLPDEAMAEWYRVLFGAAPDGGSPAVAQKRRLARSIAEELGGTGAGAAAEAEFDRVHVARQAPSQMPTVILTAGPVHLPALLEETFGVSRGQARRELNGGAVKLDGAKLPASPLDLDAAQLRGRVLQLGKRRFARLA